MFRYCLPFLVIAFSPLLFAQDRPIAESRDSLPLAQVQQHSIPAIDRDAVAVEDADRDQAGLPPRFAIPNAVTITPDTHGTWEAIGTDTWMWRLRINAPGADSVNLGFTRYRMPEGGQLIMHSADGKRVVRPFTHEDNAAHNELWTPPINDQNIVIELTVPQAKLPELELLLTHIGYGYRGFGGTKAGGGRSGSCNVDVVCPQGDPWRLEIPAIGVISTGGSTFCTGFMVNNTSNDFTPYFMTAAHCGIGSGNAASLVVFWNYETSVCGGTPDGSLSDFQTGSFWRSSYSPSDFTLVELDSDPNPAWGVTFAGWDRSGSDTSGAIAIHHPNTDEKRISFENDPTTTTSYLGTSSPGDGTHVRVEDWDEGTTEPGSSGSPLFDPNHRVIGQLHGGYAACGNDLADWYGKVSVSWNGGGTNSSRLSNWLDSAGTGALTVDTIGATLTVTPSGTVSHTGPAGGPFSNNSTVYTLSNNSGSSISYQVSLTNFIGLLIDGGTATINGNIPDGGSAQVTVTTGPDLDLLPAGDYSEAILFRDVTNSNDQFRNHDVEVGRTLAHDFPLNTSPGWTESGAWNFGSPTGGGGQYGNPDPTSGNTGPNVYGFNLNGDYNNNLPERHLTTTAIDCTGLQNTELRFYRYLNVEQPLYDHAYLRVSTNGTNFTTIWENGSEITDSSWTQQVYDISAIADNQPTVYIRWTMGTTDGSWQYSGWNIDDVQIWGTYEGEFVSYGAGCPGTGGLVPTLTGSGVPTPNGQIQIDLTNGKPNGFGLLFISSSDLQGGGCLNIAFPALANLPFSPDGAGTNSLSATLSPLLGTDWHLYFQYLGSDSGAPSGNISFSNGLDMYVR